MAKKFITRTHLSDVDGNLVAPDTEIEESRLGNAETIKRYRELEAIEDLKDSVIATGEATDESREKAQDEVVAAAEKADKTAKK